MLIVAINGCFALVLQIGNETLLYLLHEVETDK